MELADFITCWVRERSPRKRSLQGEFGVRKVIAWPLFIGSYPIIGANFTAATGYFLEIAPFVFMIGIVWLLLVTAATFVSLLSTGGRGI